MKLNFWQILGIILVVAALAIIIYQRTRPAAPASGPTTPATTAP